MEHLSTTLSKFKEVDATFQRSRNHARSKSEAAADLASRATIQVDDCSAAAELAKEAKEIVEKDLERINTAIETARTRIQQNIREVSSAENDIRRHQEGIEECEDVSHWSRD